MKRLEGSEIREIVLATNFTVEGEATALYLSGLIKSFAIKVTRLAHGMPIGGDLEYVDARHGAESPGRSQRALTAQAAA